MKVRDEYQIRYKDFGFGINNPINALSELKKNGLILQLDYKEIKNSNMNFCFEIWVTANGTFPKNEFYAKGEESQKKRLAKALVAAKICDEIYLPYNMKDWLYPLELNTEKTGKINKFLFF